MAINSGAYHLANSENTKNYQPVRTNNFRFLADFSGLNLIKVDSNPNYSDSYIDSNKAQEVIDFSVVKFNPPHFKQDEVAIKRGNSTIYFAGVPTFDTDDLIINDFAGADGKSIILAWQSLSYDITTDTIPTSDKYKINAMVIEYLPDGTYVRHWNLYGCWVSGVSEDGWDNESAGKKVVTATIRFDRAIPQQDPAELPAQ